MTTLKNIAFFVLLVLVIPFALDTTGENTPYFMGAGVVVWTLMSWRPKIRLSSWLLWEASYLVGIAALALPFGPDVGLWVAGALALMVWGVRPLIRTVARCFLRLLGAERQPGDAPGWQLALGFLFALAFGLGRNREQYVPVEAYPEG